MQRLLRRSRSFKVTDFGTIRKLIYDFLLVINSNLPHMHRFQVSYGWLLVKFSLARGQCLTFTLSPGLISANIAINDISLKKTRLFGLHFRRRKYRCIFNQFYVIRPETYRIRWKITQPLGLLRRSRSFKVTILVPNESWYVTSYD